MARDDATLGRFRTSVSRVGSEAGVYGGVEDASLRSRGIFGRIDRDEPEPDATLRAELGIDV